MVKVALPLSHPPTPVILIPTFPLSDRLLVSPPEGEIDLLPISKHLVSKGTVPVMCVSVAVSAVQYGAGGGGDSSCERVRDVPVSSPREPWSLERRGPGLT